MVPVELFFVPWPHDALHWSAELVLNGVSRFEGIDTGRVLFLFDGDIRAAVAALAMPTGTATLRGDPYCGLLLPEGCEATCLADGLRDAGHQFHTLEVVTIDADSNTLQEIDRILSTIIGRHFS